MMERSHRSTFWPRAGAFFAIVVWGISFVASKVALREVSPIVLIFTRFAMGTALLLSLLFARGHALPPRSSWPTLAVMGFVGIFVHQMLQSIALTMTSAVNTGWLIGLTPIWSAILAAVFRGERFGTMKIAGLVGGFAGALLLVTGGRFDASSVHLPSTRGDLLILVSTVNWAIFSNMGQQTIREIGASRATAISMTLGWLMLAPFFVAQAGWRELAHVSAAGWGALTFLGVGCSGLGYLLWYGALERVEVSRVAAFLYIEPLVTLVAAVLLLGEPVHTTAIVGGCIVLASVYVVQRARA